MRGFNEKRISILTADSCTPGAAFDDTPGNGFDAINVLHTAILRRLTIKPIPNHSLTEFFCIYPQRGIVEREKGYFCDGCKADHRIY